MDRTNGNIQGDYVFIRRANSLVPDSEGRKNKRNIIFIGLLNIKIISDTLFFSYGGEIHKDPTRPLDYSVDGFGIRDSSNSLKFIGFKRVSGGSTRSLAMLALSASIEDLQSGRKKFINGSVIEDEDEDSKPYHTWFHLSKISNFKALLKKLNSNKRTIFYEKDFFYRFSFDDFRADESIDDPLTIIRDHIKENYTEKCTEKCPIKYIRGKLYMDAGTVTVDIL